MNPLTFLGIALVVAVLGTLVVVVLNRPRTGMDTAMEEFQREMQALAPRQDPPQQSAPRAGPVAPDDQDHGTPPDPAMDES